MFLQAPEFFTVDGEVSVPSYVDKSSFISVLENAHVAGETALGLCACHGLGATTFARMVAEFYGNLETKNAWADLKVGSLPVMAEVGQHITLYFDFSELNDGTPNDFIKSLTKDFYTCLQKLVPGTKLSRDDVGQMLKQVSARLNKTFVLVFSNVERMQLLPMWQNYDVLTNVSRFFLELHNKATKFKALHFMLFVSAIRSALAALHVAGKRFIYDISAENSDYYDDLYGWCGVTTEELAQLLPANTELSEDQVYKWCGGYDHGVMRFNSVLSSIEENDLIISLTPNDLPSLFSMVNMVNCCQTSLFPYGDVGFAAIFNGEEINLLSPVLNESQLLGITHDKAGLTKTRAFIRKANKLICNAMLSDGLLVFKPTDHVLESDDAVLAIPNEEMFMASYNAFNMEHNYFAALNSLTENRLTIKEQLTTSSWLDTLGNMAVQYLNAQRKYFGEIFDLEYSLFNLLHGIDEDNYSVKLVGGCVLVEPINDPDGEKILLLAGVNMELSDIEAVAHGADQNELEIYDYLSQNGYGDEHKAKLTAFCYAFDIPDEYTEQCSVKASKVVVSTGCKSYIEV